MLSRIADSLYWLNRYLERTEGVLRILRTNYVLSLDKGQYGFNAWKPVVNYSAQIRIRRLRILNTILFVPFIIFC
jgi:uncharacterized alpha-E superfamily protein